MSVFGWIYAFTATIGVGWVLVSSVLAGVVGHGGHAGGGHGGPAHGGAPHADGHTDAGFPLLSPYVLSTFLAGFGLAGWAAMHAGLPPIFHVPIALGAGAVSGGAIGFLLWKLLTTLSPSGEARVMRFVGTRATVDVGIPEAGTGEITFVVDGGRRTAPARTTDGRALPTGATVFIQEMDGATALVREDAEARVRRLAEDNDTSD